MTQEAADFKEKLARLLATVLATCRFSLSQESYSVNEFRTLYNSDPPRFSHGLFASIEGTTADKFYALLKDELATAGIEWENAVSNPTLLPFYFSTTEPMGLLQSILKGGAILGPEKTTDIVHGWLHGGRLAYVRNYLRLGVELPAGVPDPFCLGHGASIRSHEPRPRAAALSRLGQENYAQEVSAATKACLVQLECKGRTAISVNGNEDAHDHEFLDLLKGEVLLSVLSLETNSFIGESYKWTDHGDWAAFIPRMPRLEVTNAEWRFRHPLSHARLRNTKRSWQGVFRNVDLESVPSAFYFDPLPREIKKSFVAPRRWRRAAGGYEVPLEDKFIELRVVVDVLLIEEHERSSSKKVAKRAEAWLGKNGVDGKSTYECIVSLYKAASEVLHAGTFQGDRRLVQEYSTALKITQENVAQMSKAWIQRLAARMSESINRTLKTGTPDSIDRQPKLAIPMYEDRLPVT